MSNSEPILAEFFTPEALAGELNRNKRTLDRWHALGIGPARTRVGRRVLYRRASVQKWLLEQENDGQRCGNDHAKSNLRKGSRA
jgi:hypothetical protein